MCRPRNYDLTDLQNIVFSNGIIAGITLTSLPKTRVISEVPILIEQCLGDLLLFFS